MAERTPNLPEICILLAANRSGTHFLRSLLNRVPRVAAPGEICNPVTADPFSFLKFRESAAIADHKFFYPTVQVQTELIDEYLNHIRPLKRDKRRLILDIKYGHVHNFDGCFWEQPARPFLLKYAIERRLRIIHLVRTKPYQTIVSRLYAENTGVWRTTDETYVPSVRIAIDRAVLQQRGSRLIRTIELFSEWLKECRHITIGYESLLSETDETLAQLQAFLGLEAAIPASSQFVKTTPPYEESIENFPEVADLIETDLAKHLAERSMVPS